MSPGNREPGVDLFSLPAGFAPEGVACAAVLPPAYDEDGPALPLCLALHGGGGSCEDIVAFKPAFDEMWAKGELPPMVIASLSAGLSFYLDPIESFVAGEFLTQLRARYRVRQDRAGTVITGMSMGGHGSLKIAFRHPDRFAAVCGLNPMIEPGFGAEDAPARNRFFYPPGLPAGLVGRTRDPALYAANHPPARARDNAAAIRDSGLAIYLAAGGDDALNAHDGAEFLHRVLWDLDIAHDHHLVAGADHIGPGLADRLRAALIWLGGIVDPSRRVAGPGGFSHEAVAGLRAQLAPLREQAAATDPTVRRRYGTLPSAR